VYSSYSGPKLLLESIIIKDLTISSEIPAIMTEIPTISSEIPAIMTEIPTISSEIAPVMTGIVKITCSPVLINIPAVATHVPAVVRQLLLIVLFVFVIAPVLGLPANCVKKAGCDEYGKFGVHIFSF
jgi:hypothetical protein